MDNFHCLIVNTNNGVERKNRDFKYEFLKPYKSKSLSGMVTVLVEQFLPDIYNRCCVILYIILIFYYYVQMSYIRFLIYKTSHLQCLWSTQFLLVQKHKYPNLRVQVYFIRTASSAYSHFLFFVSAWFVRFVPAKN